VAGQSPLSDEIVIRPYASEDKARLLAFIRQVWSFKPDVEIQFDNRWWWSVNFPPLLVADDPAANAIVGLCAFMPFTLQARAQEIPSAWFVDFYVLPQYQGKGLGRRLTERVQESFRLTASLSQTAMAYRVFARMGWSARAVVQVYMHPLPMRWMFPTTRGTLRLSNTGPSRDDLNRFWERVRQGYELIATREADELLKRYAPGDPRKYMWLTCHRGNECAGYVILRKVRSHGLFVDFLVEKGDREAFAALVSDGVRTLMREGVDRIYCLSTDSEWQRLLKSRGFLSSTTPLLGRRLGSQDKYLTYRTESASLTIDPSAWYLTLGDCDLDLAW
jgi:GNAT superfamily N-acetyltransferase